MPKSLLAVEMALIWYPYLFTDLVLLGSFLSGTTYIGCNKSLTGLHTSPHLSANQGGSVDDNCAGHECKCITLNSDILFPSEFQ